MKQITFLIFFLFVIQITKLFGTAQYGDKIIIEKDTFWINSNPLEEYFNQKQSRTINGIKIEGHCTALWRGYVATWKIQNDSLFLVRIQTEYCSENPIDLDVNKEFGTHQVFAQWVNQTIVQIKGELIHYVHADYMSIYEHEIYYNIEKGIIKEKNQKNNVVYNDKYILPAQKILFDTIKKMILKEITFEDRMQFDQEHTCFLVVFFNKSRNIEKIVTGNNNDTKNALEEMILIKAKKALANFPKLMKVKHKRYYPPIIELFFSGYCLINPKDREYGCEDE
jgi:hypothetical protein